MARPAYDPKVSSVLQVPAAEPADAEAHFRAKLAVETDPSDVKADLDKGVQGLLLVDARSAEKFSAGHVPGALNLPYRAITEETAAGLPKDRTLVVYCTSVSCNASAKAAVRLAALGFRVKEMVGGIEAWADEGYPVEVGPSAVRPATA
jgi:rhodanese-related sulfurtransferase